MLDEPGRVVLGGPQSGSVIEQADDGARPTIGRQVCLGSKAAVVTWTVSSGHLDGVLVVTWTVILWSSRRFLRGHLDGEMAVV